MTKRNWSSLFARRGRCGTHAGHGNKKQNSFYYDCHTICTNRSHAFRLGFRSELGPNYQTTQHDRLCHVTLTLSRYTVSHLSSSVKPSSFLVNRKPKKTGDSLHTNPPLACNTQQYAAQITLKQNTNMHLGAITPKINGELASRCSRFDANSLSVI